jgi:hypothetical protein
VFLTGSVPIILVINFARTRVAERIQRAAFVTFFLDHKLSFTSPQRDPRVIYSGYNPKIPDLADTHLQRQLNNALGLSTHSQFVTILNRLRASDSLAVEQGFILGP